MAEWMEFNAATLLPGPTQQVLEGCDQVAQTIATAADTLATIIEQIANLLAAIDDPIRAVIEQLINQLKTLLGDVMGTGLYLYYDSTGLPFYKLRSFDSDAMIRAMDIDADESARRAEMESRGEPYEPPKLFLEPQASYGWNGWMARFKASIDDLGDTARPTFSDQAEVSALLIIAGTPAIDALPALLAALGKLLSLGAFASLFDEIPVATLTRNATAGDSRLYVDRVEGFRTDHFALLPTWSLPDIGDWVTVKEIDYREMALDIYGAIKRDWPAGSAVMLSCTDPSPPPPSHAPDWSSITLRDIEPLAQLERLIQKLIGLLELAPSFLDLLDKLAAALKEKAQQLRELAAMIQEIIEMIELLLTATGVYIIKLDSGEGVAGLFAQLDAAERPPLPDRSYLFGACLLAGTADLGPVAALFGA